MLVKIFFTGFVIFCVWMLSTRMRKSERNTDETVSRVKTVKCAVCGVYMPQDEARLVNQNEYRCEEHAG